MKLREMIATHPEKFYPQTWYFGEEFLEKKPIVGVPGHTLLCTPHPAGLVEWSAADLAHIWLEQNEWDQWLWHYYLWTNDFDHLGQRIYVGQNGKGLEIHRHLHITDRWAIPI